MTSSACSALLPRTKSWAATRPGRVAGGSGTTTGPGSVRADGSHGLCWNAGSDVVTQVSLLVLRPRPATTGVSGSVPTRVRPPGSRRNPWPGTPPAVRSATANVRRITGRGTSDPSASTVGTVDGVRISWPTQSPGRDRTRSTSWARSTDDRVAGRNGPCPT